VLNFFSPNHSLNLMDEMWLLVGGGSDFVDRFREVWGLPYVVVPSP
jgi:hypothetical protein